MPITPVDGQGMWRAWVRTFENPEAACLDLLDNCFDATLHEGFNGKAVMNALELEPNKYSTRSKNSSLFRGKTCAANGDTCSPGSVSFKKDAIEENGVGLKRGCATLSDVSFIVTRNGNRMEVGLIAKQLQSSKGVCLRHFSFEVPEDFHDEMVSQMVDMTLEQHAVITAVLAQTLGRGNSQKGKTILVDLVRSTWKGDWKQQNHVFLLVLHKLHHMAYKFEAIDVEDPISPAIEFLDNVIKPMLPEHYIKVTSNANFRS